MGIPEEKVINFPPQEQAAPDRSLITRWKHEELFDGGFLGVPVLFLKHYAHLKPHPLSTGEAIFTLQLMSFKWGSDAPFPSYERVAKRMGVTDKAVRRYAKDMEAKGYLRRQKRVGQTNRFDLSGLFDALLRAVERAKEEAKEGGDNHV